MDSIRITITRNCNPDGSGGTVVDDAAAVLGSLPDGTPILDATAAAFATAYGLHSPPGDVIDAETGETKPGEPVPVSPLRNISYRLRAFAQEVVAGWASTQAAKVAAEQATAATAAALAGIAIVETEIGKAD